VMIGPGSVIDVHALLAELEACKGLVSREQIIIHPHAAVVSQRHRDEEAGPMTKIGSTKKGTGAAMIQRIRRNPDDMNTAESEIKLTPLSDCVVSVDRWIDIMVNEVESAQIESAQGYSLSMYHGFYPYTTSRDVSTAQTLADCGIPFDCFSRALTTVIGTCRTYPIRVANRHDSEGRQVGWSGPCYPDQEETSFEAIGQPTELTTVTKLPRRIFTYSKMQMEQAIRMNGVNKLFLNFANYAPRETLLEIMDHLSSLTEVRWTGWGPAEQDVRDV